MNSSQFNDNELIDKKFSHILSVDWKCSDSILGTKYDMKKLS